MPPIKKRPAASLSPTLKKRSKQRVVETQHQKLSVKRKPGSVEIDVTQTEKLVVPRMRSSVKVPQKPVVIDVSQKQDAKEAQKEKVAVNSVFVKNRPTGSRVPTQARFESTHFAEGNFRKVFKGIYVQGARMGESCVMKEFKSGCVYADTFYEDDIKAVKKTGGIIKAFNELGIVSKNVYLNEPEVWTGLLGRITSQKILVEPFITGEYFKFNSNTGYTREETDTMQALSHFSYHHSGGEYLLCDLQGGRSGGCYVLTDPVILSRRKEFGATDLGEKGINNFMAYHQCGRFCDPNWKMPRADKLVPVFKAVSGTTFGNALQIFSNATMQDLQNKVKKCWMEHLPN